MKLAFGGGRGGALRSFGDIGTRWIDLTSFVTGLKTDAVMAERATFIPERQKSTGPLETFRSSAGETEPVAIETDDTAMIVIRYPGGARGVMSMS